MATMRPEFALTMLTPLTFGAGGVKVPLLVDAVPVSVCEVVVPVEWVVVIAEVLEERVSVLLEAGPLAVDGGGVAVDGGALEAGAELGGMDEDSVGVVDGGAGAGWEIVEVISVVVSTVEGVVSVTTLEIGVDTTTGGVLGEAVGQSVTVTVTVTWPGSARTIN